MNGFCDWMYCRGSCDPHVSVRIGWQTELDSLRRHRVIEELPNGHDGTHMQGGWTEDCKRSPLCRQLASSARDDVAQSTPAMLVFKLMIAMCSQDFCA